MSKINVTRLKFHWSCTTSRSDTRSACHSGNGSVRFALYIYIYRIVPGQWYNQSGKAKPKAKIWYQALLTNLLYCIPARAIRSFPQPLWYCEIPFLPSLISISACSNWYMVSCSSEFESTKLTLETNNGQDNVTQMYHDKPITQRECFWLQQIHKIWEQLLYAFICPAVDPQQNMLFIIKVSSVKSCRKSFAFILTNCPNAPNKGWPHPQTSHTPHYPQCTKIRHTHTPICKVLRKIRQPSHPTFYNF